MGAEPYASLHVAINSDGMDAHSILFPKSQWGLQMAKRWATEHGYTLECGVDLADGHYYRIQQRAPQKGAKCRREMIRSRTYGTDIILLRPLSSDNPPLV